MSAVTSFRVTGDWRHIVDDGMVDVDDLPDEVLPTGTVKFRPLYPTVATAGVPAVAYTFGTVPALIAGGVLTDLQGREGVRLAGKVGEHTVRWSAEIELTFQGQKVPYPSPVAFELDQDTVLSAIIQQAGRAMTPIVLDPRVEALAGRLAEADEIVQAVEGYASTAAGAVGLAKAEAERAIGLSTAQDEHIAGTLEDPESATHAAFKAVGNATYATVQKADEVVTVGTGGHFATINEALAALSVRHMRYAEGGRTVEIRLLSGFVMAERVYVRGVDLSWITITSEDAEVTVRRSAIPASADNCAFLAADHGTLPIIGTIFVMDDSGTSPSTRLFRAINASQVIFRRAAGAKGHAERLLEIAHGSRCIADYAVITDSDGLGIRVSNNSTLLASFATITGHADVGVAVGTSVVNLQGADVSGAGASGLRLSPGPSIVQAPDLTADNCGVYGIDVQYGGSVSAPGLSAAGCGQGGVNVDGPGQVDCRDADLSNSGAYAISATNGATVNAPGANLTEAGQSAIFARSGATVTAPGCNAHSATVRAVDARAATVVATSATLTGAGEQGVFASDGAFVNAQAANCRRSTEDSVQDIRVSNSSTVNARGATGGLWQLPNSLRPDGVILTADRITAVGNATIPSAANPVIVPHTLTRTPSSAQIQATLVGQLGAASHLWISDVGATTFRINVNAPPGRDVAVAWRASLE